jgi:hypothetical protein
MTPEIAQAIAAQPPINGAMIWIASQPIWYGTLLLVALPMVLSVLGVLLVNLLAGRAALIENNIVGGAKFAFLAQVFCSLLAFVIVDGAIRYNQVRANIQTEVSALRLFIETVEQVQGDAAAKVRPAVRRYADAVVSHEFQTMQLGAESPLARAAMDQVIARYTAISAGRVRDQLDLLQADQLLSKALLSRAGRLNAVRPGLKAQIWSVVACNVLLAIAFNWFFGNPSLRMQAFMAALLTAAIMIVTYMALLLYHPFCGDLSISPSTYAVLRAR